MTSRPDLRTVVSEAAPAGRSARDESQTLRYPLGPLPVLPRPWRTPRHDAGRCDGTGACATACPTGALEVTSTGGQDRVTLDYGKCLFCSLCVDACPSGAMTSTPFEELSVRRRGDLIAVHPSVASLNPSDELRREVATSVGRLFAGSLSIRAVDAGSCNGCEVEVGALLWPRYDLERLGIHLVASPRHADALLVTGPVTRNMRQALEKTYRAVPPPRFVLAVGACGISGGPFAGSAEVEGGVDRVLPVEVYIPGCPPSPVALLHGLWLALGKVEQRMVRGEFSSGIPP